MSLKNHAKGIRPKNPLGLWRVFRGVPAVFVDLGAVKAVGVAAENAGVLDRLQRTGHLPLSEDQVLGVLGSAILAPYEPQVVVGLNSGPSHHWDRTGESQLGRDARFSALRACETLQMNGKSSSGTPTGDSSSLAGRLALPSHQMKQPGPSPRRLSDILMIPVDDIKLENRPAKHGMDSLIAAESRNMPFNKPRRKCPS